MWGFLFGSWIAGIHTAYDWMCKTELDRLKDPFQLQFFLLKMLGSPWTLAQDHQEELRLILCCINYLVNWCLNIFIDQTQLKILQGLQKFQ